MSTMPESAYDEDDDEDFDATPAKKVKKEPKVKPEPVDEEAVA